MNFFKMLILIALFPAFASAGDDFLLRYTYQPGFEFQPVRKTTTVHPSGLVVYETQALSSGEESRLEIAQLSSASITRLQKRIETINAKDLVDLDENESFCTDTPTPTYEVKNGAGEAITISSLHACHRFEMPNSTLATELKALLVALTNLAENN